MKNSLFDLAPSSRKIAWIFGFGVLALILVSGCVDINDAKVQVRAPEDIDNRNVLDKCTPHVYPHRLIIGHMAGSTQMAQNGPQLFGDQKSFDQYWTYVAVDSADPDTINTTTNEPNINWDQQVAYFYVFQPVNSCEKIKPMPDGMTTDCYTISLPILRYQEGTDCKPPSSYQVFIYIFSKVNLPYSVVWVFPTPSPTPEAVPALTPTPTATPAVKAEG